MKIDIFGKIMLRWETSARSENVALINNEFILSVVGRKEVENYNSSPHLYLNDLWSIMGWFQNSNTLFRTTIIIFSTFSLNLSLSFFDAQLLIFGKLYWGMNLNKILKFVVNCNFLHFCYILRIISWWPVIFHLPLPAEKIFIEIQSH